MVNATLVERKNAWDILGYDVSACKTNNEILQTAKITWTVRKRSLHFEMEGAYLPLDDFNQFGLFRVDTNELLSVVSSSYVPVQNSVLIRFISNLFQTNNLPIRFSTCGSLRNGKIVFANVFFSQSTIGKSVIDNYITFTIGHDGLHGLECFISQMRNDSTYTIVLPDSISSSLFKMRHTLNVLPKLDNVTQFFKGVTSAISRVNRQLQFLHSVVVTPEKLEKYLAELYPSNSTRGRNIQNTILELYNLTHGTWYDLFNVTVDYVDHYRSVRIVDDDSLSVEMQRADSALFGSGASVKHRAFALCTKMAK